MKEIWIKGKRFVPMIEKQVLAERISVLAKQVEARIEGEENVLFVVMLNGAFMFAADFLRCLNGSVETKFVRYTSYAGMESTGEMKRDAVLGESDVKGRVVVVLEDIVDTGGTMKVFAGDMVKLGAKGVLVATMFARDREYDFGERVEVCPAIVLKDDAFIVGFGLDFDGEGRNLGEVWKNEE